jgi:hypothetical protein
VINPIMVEEEVAVEVAVEVEVDPNRMMNGITVPSPLDCCPHQIT